MTWPTVAVNTTNTDASTDSPANARADFLDLEQKVNQMIANGAPVLQAGTQTIDGSKTFSSSPTVPTGSASNHAVNKSQMDAADALRLLKSSNLSDVVNAAAALANLGGVAASAFTGANQSLGGSGYQKLPGGLIVQWGTAVAGALSSSPVSFPVSFPSAVVHIGCSVVPGSVGTIYSSTGPLSGSITTSGFTYVNSNSGGSAFSYWIAIGY